MRRKLSISGAALAVAFVAMAAESAGQYPSPDTPLDSPLWWPLADGVTAHDLYMAGQPEGLAKSYREAVALGLLPDCGPDFVPTSFAGNHRPDLMTMGYALDVFQLRAEADNTERRIEETIASGTEDLLPEPASFALTLEFRQGLESAGLSAGAVDDLEFLLDDASRATSRSAEAARPAHEAVDRMLNDYIERENLYPPEFGLRHGSEAWRRAVREEDEENRQRRIAKGLAYEKALKEGDDLYLSMELGGDRGDWQEWLQRIRADHDTGPQARLLVSLRERLSDADWLALRRYLIATVSDNLSLGLGLGPNSRCEADLQDWMPWSQRNREETLEQ